MARQKRADEDRFRQLPVSVLALILSFLPLREAAATSILSRFWRRIWLFSDVFDFDAFKVFNHPPTPQHTPEYVEWISDVLQSHRQATRNDDVENPFVLKKLRIRMHLDKSFQSQLHEWISYASECRVQSLELDFMVKISEILVPFFDLCSFSGTFAAETDLTCLTSLSLAAVNVTGEVVQSLLHKYCPFLESLKVSRSDVLGHLEICGSSLVLKHLEVTYCEFAHLTVHDTSLVSLTVTWLEVLALYNNPKLVAVRATQWYSPLFRSFEFCLHQLEVLTVCTCLPSLPGRNKYIKPLVAPLPPPPLPRMKQLTLYVQPLREDSVNFATNLLSRATNLEKLGLEFVHVTKKWIPTKNKGEVNKSPRFPRLKVVEVRGYYGEPEEDKILEFISQHAEAPPEKVIFDLHNLGRDMYPPRSFPRAGVQRSEDERVARLKRVVPSSAEFIVT